MANPEKWTIMYLHIRLSNLSFSTVLIFGFGLVSAVWYLFFSFYGHTLLYFKLLYFLCEHEILLQMNITFMY